MLSAGAARAISVYADLVGLDVDLYAIVDLGGDEDARERSVTPLGLIERRDADEAMNTDLALQQAERIWSRNGKSRRLDAGFFRGLVVVDIRFEALLFCPAQVHAVEHLRP